MLSKFQYFTRNAARWLYSPEFACTNCGSSEYSTIDRKYFVTFLRRCAHCRLMYRVPTDDAQANYSFYQKAYQQGFTTELPSPETLAKLVASGFDGSEKSYRYYISILDQLGLGKDAKVFDYGCSWGFGSWQFKTAGYTVASCEISRPRAEFAKDKLGVDIREISNAMFDGDLKHSFDIFFSAHVLEHVPSPAKVIELAKNALKPSGIFVAVTPNGSEPFRRSNPRAWHRLWGKVHPSMIDCEYYRHEIGGDRIFLDTSPINLEKFSQFLKCGNTYESNLTGDELVCVAKLHR